MKAVNFERQTSLHHISLNALRAAIASVSCETSETDPGTEQRNSITLDNHPITLTGGKV